MARAASKDIVVLGSRRKAKLEAITRRASAPQALARRARIVLLAHAGWPNARIAAGLGCAQGTIRTWRRRFAPKHASWLDTIRYNQTARPWTWTYDDATTTRGTAPAATASAQPRATAQPATAQAILQAA